ncbi:MAG TPA: EamA family transporter [Thermoleophilia bacterium]|nr:EamA family transporter [Thermoleophilia bacterium]
MLTVLLGLGSALGYVLHDYLMVKVVRSVAVWTAMCWSMGFGMLVLVPLALVLHGLPSGTAQWHAVAWAMAGGLCEAAALACLLRGLVTGNLSIVTPLASLAGGIVAVIAVAGGESLAAPAMIGLPLAVAGGLLASIEKAPAEGVLGVADGGDTDADEPPPRRRGTAGAGWALLSSALFAVVILLLDQATALPSVSIAACGRLGTMAVLIPVTLLLGGLRLPREYVRRCGLAGVADATGFVLFAAAIIIGPLAVASVVISQGGTMAVLLGYVALRERLSKVQYVGVACTIVACTLFALN